MKLSDIKHNGKSLTEIIWQDMDIIDYVHSPTSINITINEYYFLVLYHCNPDKIVKKAKLTFKYPNEAKHNFDFEMKTKIEYLEHTFYSMKNSVKVLQDSGLVKREL